MPIVSLPAEWHSSTFPTAAPHRTQLFPFRAQFQLFTWPPTTHNRWEMEKWAVVVHSDCSNCNFETQLGRHKATRGRPLLEHKPPIKYKCLRFSEQPPAHFFSHFFQTRMFWPLSICTWPVVSELEGQLSCVMKGASQDTCFLFKPGQAAPLYSAKDLLTMRSSWPLGACILVPTSRESEKCDSKNFEAVG